MSAPTATSQKFCHACGRSIDVRAEICPHCGVRQPMAYGAPLGVNTPSGRNRIAAALFAIFLGGFGVHKFYLGRVGQGILYLIFCWTFIPSFIGFIEGIIYLTKSDQEFAVEYG
jgi:TM2 domain-containing membrane protein YozV